MYWLQLDKRFYANPRLNEIKKLEEGKDFIIIYCILLLTGGSSIPCNKREISRLSGVSEEKAAKAMNAFYRQKLVKLVEKPDEMAKPSYDEVEEYAREIGSRVDVGKFYHWYEADNFEFRGKPMDWKAKLRSWTEREKPRVEANPFLRMIKEQVIEHS